MTDWHARAWAELRDHIYNRACANAEFGYPEKKLPAPEELELPWEYWMVPRGQRRITIVVAPPQGTVLVPTGLPDFSDVQHVEILPLAASVVQYAPDVAPEGRLYWWYGLGLHPRERTYILMSDYAPTPEIL